MKGNDTLKKNVVGRWKKIVETECSDTYPDDLEFMANNIYFGRKGEEGTEFTLWDSGGYQIVSPNQIKISTANDAEIVYQLSFSSDILKFIDNGECEIRYRRVW